MTDDTTIRVTAKTYATMIRTRGAFEQTFGKKLSLDDAMYLAGSYVNIAYDIYKDLEQQGLVKIVPTADGSFTIDWSSRVDKILDGAIPRIMKAFENLKKMLNEKKMTTTVANGAVS
jgi:sulfatase maturation enzyme AslB (radical SAM superfamily)